MFKLLAPVAQWLALSGSKGLGFKTHQSCGIFQPWLAPAQSWECYGLSGKAGPHNQASSTPQMCLRVLL